TPEGQMLTNIRGVFAEYERAKILERTARGRRARAQAGHAPYGRTTYGYRYVKHTVTSDYHDPATNQCCACHKPSDKGACYVIHPEEAAVVQRIFRLYAEGGYSLIELAALLTKESVPTPTGRWRTLPVKVWHPASLGAMLRNETYLGTMYEGKTQRVAGERNPDRKTRYRQVPKAAGIARAAPPLTSPAPL